MGRDNWTTQIAAALARTVAALLLAATATPPASAQTTPVQIDVASVILVEPAVEALLPIQIAGNAETLKQAFVRIRGLPQNAVLSDGHAIKPGNWAIPLATLPSLKIEVPVGTEGKFQVRVAVLLVTGEMVREVETTLVVVPAAAVVPGARTASTTTTTVASAATLPTVPQPNPPSALAPPPLRLTPERPPPPPAAAVPEQPVLQSEDRDRAVKFMQRGDEGLSAGNVTIARLFYQRAADIGWAPGALALAGTYDPFQLAQLKVLGGISADRALAQKWYERARELGAPQAAQRLRQLGVQ